MAVYRVYVEKSPEYAVEAQGLLKEIRHILLIKSVTGVRVLNRYDVEGIEQALFDRCMPVVFSEPPVDVTYDRLPEGADAVIAVEYLPGQFDARAASCEECIQLVSQGERPTVRTARVYLFTGTPTPEELDRIRRHLINPVESREADLAEKETLRQQYDTPETVETLEGFNALDGDEIGAFVQKYGLAMDRDDLAFCQAYFRSEQRDPTITEIRMIDTYWSDHCRHTTFLTTLDDVICGLPAVRIRRAQQSLRRAVLIIRTDFTEKRLLRARVIQRGNRVFLRADKRRDIYSVVIYNAVSLRVLSVARRPEAGKYAAAGAYTHTSIAILDALKAVSVPAAEVHISDVAKREDFRQVSYLGMACCCKFAGEGKQGYVHAIEKLIEIIRSKNT